jgi:hypothetical protein
VGVAASALLLSGKFLLGSGLAVTAGVAALVGASLWNSWPARPAAGAPPAPAETLYQIGGIKKET